jgi:hypothetical protein
MTRLYLLASLAIALQAMVAHAGPSWLPALTYAEAPTCSEHVGARTFYSDVIEARRATAEIIGRSERRASGCKRDAELEITREGVRASVPLSDADNSVFSIVDFSPSNNDLLISAQRLRKYPDEGFRSHELAVASAAQHALQWENAWDLFGWADCDAVVEPQGFTSDGRVVVLARPSVMVPKRRGDCVRDWGLYDVDLRARTVTRLPESLKLQRYGKIAHHASEACASDPDLVGPSFTVHGRLSIWNGSPSLRILRIGTKRILGVEEGFPPPESIASKLGSDSEAIADFLVFPFSPERPGEMQMVCIESAGKVIFERLKPIGRGP